MITNNFEDYSYRFDNKEQFQEWLADHCDNCWRYGFGDCSVCNKNKAKIKKAFDEMVGEDK